MSSARRAGGRERNTALTTIDANAAICNTPRAPDGSVSPNTANPAAIGTAFVASVASPAAVRASPCWNAPWSRLVPSP